MVREINTHLPQNIAQLLEDPEVKRWHANLRRGSPATADMYAANLARFLHVTGTMAQGLLALENKVRGNVVADYVGQLEDLGRAGTYIKTVKQCVRSWLSWNSLGIGRPIKIHGTNQRPSLRTAHAAVPRARCAMALMAFSGVRPEVMGNYKGTDGLRVRDLADAHLNGNALVFDQVPCRIQVRELSKTKQPYFTFLGPEGCQYLQAHLAERAADGETLDVDSPIITPRNLAKPFMRSTAISGLIREPMRAAGLKEPPYIWRSYFNNRCLNAERYGLLRDYRVFFMGHKGDLEFDYGLRSPPTRWSRCGAATRRPGNTWRRRRRFSWRTRPSASSPCSSKRGARATRKSRR